MRSWLGCLVISLLPLAGAQSSSPTMTVVTDCWEDGHFVACTSTSPARTVVTDCVEDGRFVPCPTTPSSTGAPALPGTALLGAVLSLVGVGIVLRRRAP